VSDLELRPEVAKVLVGSRSAAALFEETVALGAPADKAANWVTQDLAALVNEAPPEADGGKVGADHLAELIAMLEADEISGAGAKQALEEAFATGEPIASIVERSGLRQVSDVGELGQIADAVVLEYPDVVAKFRSGNEGVIGFLVGEVMKRSGGTANPKVAQELLRERLRG
jgi:aspartyl-tRNA(Asn)/glutamyl-tRNA(Gln) amidotransferase subunit B